MGKYFFIFFCTLILFKATAQSTAGITGIPDTSFNISSEYQKILKTYPGIKMIPPIEHRIIKAKKNISYCKTGERELTLDVFCPAKKIKNNHIAILLIHGGGWRSGNKEMFHPMAEHLAALGYVCITPAYQLSTEALYPAAVYDIKSAVRWVRKHASQYDIDTSKIVVAGHSSGGELAAMMGATNDMVSFEGGTCNLNHSSTVNAVIDIDGILAFIHPESGEGDDSKRTSAATNWFGYSKTTNPALWKEASPLTHAGKNSPPILFINSNVARMHAGREDYIKLMNEYHIYTEVRTFDAPHSFCLFEPWFTPTIHYMDEFLKKVFAKQ
ncbi:MAG TPA: alpha/beta hydrolase [Ferruginibacter sp.]|jgi:acetyl esterase/lipase|nr:alpha/beta hydrolase [Ferruginibacter sp.]